MAPGAAAHGPRLCDLCFLRRCFEADEGPPIVPSLSSARLCDSKEVTKWTGVLCGFEAAL